MPMPRRTGAIGDASSGRSGIDQVDPAVLVTEVDNYSAADAFLRALAAIEAGRPDWHADAACRGSDIDFTSAGGSQQKRALQVCGGCEVRQACLDWALELDDRVAIAGGQTPAARRRLARDRQRANDKEGN